MRRERLDRRDKLAVQIAQFGSRLNRADLRREIALQAGEFRECAGDRLQARLRTAEFGVAPLSGQGQRRPLDAVLGGVPVQYDRAQLVDDGVARGAGFRRRPAGRVAVRGAGADDKRRADQKSQDAHGQPHALRIPC